jgi:thioredoxin
MADIKEIVSDSALRAELSLSGNCLVVVDFFATWCGPCREIAPKIVHLQTKYTQVVFLKVDIDKCSNIAAHYEVRSVPTFIFFQKSEVIHRIRGADVNGIEAIILQHTSGDIPGSTSGPLTKDLEIPGQHILNGLIDKGRSECLNDSDEHSFYNCLSPDSAFLQSDCDEQLIMFISFSQSVRLHSLLVKASNRGMDRAPKSVVVFLNQVSTPSFDDVERMNPVQMFSLTPDQLTGDCPLPLTYVKFQNVQSVTLTTKVMRMKRVWSICFVKDNQGDEDETCLEYLLRMKRVWSICPSMELLWM